MSELTSKAEVTPMEAVNSFGQGFDPDRRIAEQSIDGCHPPIEVNSPGQGFDPDRRIAEQSVDGGHPSIDHGVHKNDSDARAGGDSVAFKGLTNVETIADIQKARTCWAESLENVIQLVHGDKQGKLNGLSEKIIEMVAADPMEWQAVESPKEKNPLNRWNIGARYYPKVLGKYDVRAENVPFSHKTLQDALSDNRPVILFGDVKHIGKYEGDRGPHALVAVDWEPDTGRYVLLDSNFKNIYKVSPEELKKFADDQYVNNPIGWICRFFLGGEMTVVQTPARWSDWHTFVDGRWHTFVNNLEVDPFQAYDEWAHKVAPSNGTPNTGHA